MTMNEDQLKIKTKALASKRLEQAEDFLLQSIGLIERARAEISVIGTGLNQNWSKLGDLQEKLKTQMYDLQRCRDSGRCDLDETMANLLLKKGKKG
jgi:hypothetical protein